MRVSGGITTRWDSERRPRVSGVKRFAVGMTGLWKFGGAGSGGGSERTRGRGSGP